MRISNTVTGVVSTRLMFFFQAEDGIRDLTVTGVQTCALPISVASARADATAAGRPAVAAPRARRRGAARAAARPGCNRGSGIASFAQAAARYPKNTRSMPCIAAMRSLQCPLLRTVGDPPGLEGYSPRGHGRNDRPVNP